MAVSVHCTSVQVSANGRIYVNFASGNQMEFSSLAEMIELANAVDAPEMVNTAQLMLIKWWLSQDTEASNTALVAGRQMTFDLTAVPSPLFIQNLGVGI